MRLATIIGARPQFIKAEPISSAIKLSDNLSEIIIHTGQHFEKNMSKIFFDEMGLPSPDYNLQINKVSPSVMVKKMYDKITRILKEEEFNGVLVYGDTNSTLAGCLAANKVNIPIFHVEAGLRSYNRQMPEEINRILTDHLSTLLFSPNQTSVNNLKKEKLTKGVINTGDVMYDVYKKFSQYSEKNIQSISKPYILTTIHRRENIESEKALVSIFKSLDKINDKFLIVMPLHPHTKKKIEKYNIQSKIDFIEPVGYLQMLSLIKNCQMVITDSGGLQKESFFAKKKCIVVRKETEWIELINDSINILSKPNKIFDSFQVLSLSKVDFSKEYYGDGMASKKIVESIINFFYDN